MALEGGERRMTTSRSGGLSAGPGRERAPARRVRLMIPLPSHAGSADTSSGRPMEERAACDRTGIARSHDERQEGRERHEATSSHVVFPDRGRTDRRELTGDVAERDGAAAL